MQATCQSYGANLTWIHSEDEDRFIADMAARLGNDFNFVSINVDYLYAGRAECGDDFDCCLLFVCFI